MPRLQGKVAIVTGGARGIGRAISQEFAAEGASVVVADILEDEGRDAAASLGPLGYFERLDVRLADDWARVVNTTTSRIGPPTVLVNNAAILHLGPVATFDVTTYREIIETNQIGCYLGLQAVIPGMRAAGGGSIINVSSVDGRQGTPGTSAYSATKWALRGLTKVAAMELGPHAIRVNTINPGGIATSMTSPANLTGVKFRPIETIMAGWPLRRLGAPAEVASFAVFLASDESSFVTGAEMTVDGGATAGHPYAEIE